MRNLKKTVCAVLVLALCLSCTASFAMEADTYGFAVEIMLSGAEMTSYVKTVNGTTIEIAIPECPVIVVTADSTGSMTKVECEKTYNTADKDLDLENDVGGPFGTAVTILVMAADLVKYDNDTTAWATAFDQATYTEWYIEWATELGDAWSEINSTTEYTKSWEVFSGQLTLSETKDADEKNICVTYVPDI